MSKRNRRKTATLERAQSSQRVGREIPQHELQAALAKLLKSSGSNDALFSPGLPMDPQKGANPQKLPVNWMFPVGYNTYTVDRPQNDPEMPSFEQLRRFAKLYSGITLCLRVILDLVPNLKLDIKLTDDMVADGKEEKDFQKEIRQYKAFFSKPFGADDPRNFYTWMRIALKEQYTVDELYLYKRKTKGGDLFGLTIVAGDTMKPLLDEWGTVIGYKQFPRGIPGENFSFAQMVRHNESPSADSPFGFSRVENIILEVNQALRKKKKDLAQWTEGNQPFAIMEVPEASNWTPDQIEVFEQMWNSLIAGNPQQQVRVKFTQAGMKYTPLEQYQLDSAFDQFLLNIAAASFGLSMQDLAFTGDIHKSSGDSQQNVLGRRVLYPITSQYASLFTDVLRDDFHDDRFVVTIGGFEEMEDLNTQATAYATMIQNAVISPANAARAMKQPDIPETGPLFVTKAGITPLANYEEGSEFRKASDDAQLAGFKLAANPQQPQPGQENMQGDESANAKPGKPQPPTAKANQDEEEDDPKERIADLRRWKKRAVEDVKQGKAFRGFSTTYIPDTLHAQISTSLERCTTVEEVHGVFERAVLPVQHWQDFDKDVLGALAKMKASGVVSQTWKCRPGACDDCLLNQGATVPLYSRFPNGAMTTPCHGNCECTATQNKAVKVHA